MLLLALGTQEGWGQATGNAGDRQRNFDAREALNQAFQAQPSAQQQQALAQLRTQVPGLAVRFERTTGAARNISTQVGYLTGPNNQGDPRQIALGFVNANLSLLGLTPADLDQHEVTDSVYSAATGATHLYLRQAYRGIAVYNGQLQVHVNRQGRIVAVNNAFLPNLSAHAPPPVAARGAAEALEAAAAHLEIALSASPTLIAVDSGPQQATRLEQNDLSGETIEAKLMWLPIRAANVRLVWNFQLHLPDGQHLYDMNVDARSGQVWTRFDWVNSSDFKVYERPVESPQHTTPLPPADARTVATNPENSTASPSGWFGGGTMVGNNVHACADTNANNLCDTPEPSCAGTTCSFPIDLTVAPSNYIDAAVTNLFYWNNIIHDVQYQYGFDEAAGNFQENNFAKGGVGSDSVNADAQDGSGTCNANFSTPTDGGNPRMQMYTCGNATPARDGDFDNGVIVHEYGHGISVRQVGGPSNSSCLNNTQQPGEGWSDWHGLVYTAKTGDLGTDVRGTGSYLFALGPNGTIRPQPYSTNPAVNNYTYESIAGKSVPHGVGSVWAQAIWEVYWALVDQHGFDSNLYNAFGGAGNQRALLYINEGLKNTACSPTFLDARDGIIQAATDNFNGEDVCTIWGAFAAYGLGTDAATPGSGSQTATNGFQVPLACSCQPSPIADAGSDKLICLGDSTVVGTPAQPDNTYSWAPGGETTAQITVSPVADTTYTITATAACGSDFDAATVFVDPDGTRGGLSDDFEGGVSGWTTNGLWHLANNSTCASPGYSSAANAFYYGQDGTCNYNTGAATSGTLTSPVILGITGTSTLSFDYYRVVENFQGDFDKTDVEIVTDSGVTVVWSRNSSNSSSAAWQSSGSIDLSAFAGQAIQVRFRFNSVDAVSNNFTGWFIDDVVVTGTSPCTGPPNQTPTAAGQSLSTGKNVSLPITLSASDGDDDNLTFSIVAPDPLEGSMDTLTPAADCSATNDCTAQVTFTPALDFAGTASFTFTVNDGLANSNFATVTVEVTNPNTPPVATPQSVSTDEDNNLPITLTGSDGDNDPLTFGIVSGPSNGSLSGTAPNVTYNPNPNFNGSDSFTFNVNDGTEDSTPATVSITVNPVNDAPSFTKGADQTVSQSAGPQTVVGWATAISPGPANESGQTVAFVITSNDNTDLFSVGPTVSPTGTLTYTPNPLAAGLATIGVKITDDGGVANGGVDESPGQNFVITTTAPPEPLVDNLATADFANARGTVAGTYVNTQDSDDSHEQLTEEQQGGNPNKSRSLLDHTWTFDVVAGNSYHFRLEAHHSVSADGDDFLFSYSTDNTNYFPMLTVTKTSDDDSEQNFEFPGDVSGTLYIRAQDTNNSQGPVVLDTLFVDFMAVTTSTGGVDTFPPTAPTGLAATAGNATVSLDWDDNTEGDLDGYNVYRSSSSGGPYTMINGPLLGASAYVDSGLTNGNTYFYVVTAVDTTGNESNNSLEVMAMPAMPGTPSSVHVQSVVTSTANAGQGNKRGQAVVTIVNNLGSPVSGATVNGQFSGTFNEAASGPTGGAGTVTLVTFGSAKGSVSVAFCVSNVTGSLPYVPGDNGPGVSTCP